MLFTKNYKMQIIKKIKQGLINRIHQFINLKKKLMLFHLLYKQKEQKIELLFLNLKLKEEIILIINKKIKN